MASYFAYCFMYFFSLNVLWTFPKVAVYLSMASFFVFSLWLHLKGCISCTLTYWCIYMTPLLLGMETGSHHRRCNMCNAEIEASLSWSLKHQHSNKLMYQLCLENKTDCMLQDRASGKLLHRVRFIQTHLLCIAPCPRKLKTMKTSAHILRNSMTADKILHFLEQFLHKASILKKWIWWD